MNFSQLHEQYLVMLVVGGFLLVLLACGGHSDSGNGVARVGDAEPVPTHTAWTSNKWGPVYTCMPTVPTCTSPGGGGNVVPPSSAHRA